MKTFAAVIFKSMNGPETTGVIPVSWLLKTQKMCFFPPGPFTQKTKNRIKRCCKPDKENWERIKVKVVKTYDTFSEATIGSKKACNTSSLEDTDREERERRNTIDANPLPPLFQPSFTECTSNDNEIASLIPAPSPTPKSSSPIGIWVPPPESPSLPAHQEPSSPPWPCLRPSSTPLTSRANTGCSMDCMKMQATMGRMEAVLTDLYQEVMAMKAQKSSRGDHHRSYSRATDLPLTTLEEFDNHESSISVEKEADDLITILKHVGGRHPKTMLYNCMRKCMDSRLGEFFSYSGQAPKNNPLNLQRKRPFKNTRLMQCIEAAVLSTHPSTNEDELKKHVSLWLQQAKKRTSARKNVEETLVEDRMNEDEN